MRFLRYIRAYWRAPTHPNAYERGRIDALHAVLALLNEPMVSIPQLRTDVEERVRQAERSA